jgi:acyl carrier protein
VTDTIDYVATDTWGNTSTSSLDTIELVMAFEQEFDCEIPDDAGKTILTVRDAVKFLEKNAIT